MPVDSQSASNLRRKIIQAAQAKADATTEEEYLKAKKKHDFYIASYNRFVAGNQSTDSNN